MPTAQPSLGFPRIRCGGAAEQGSGRPQSGQPRPPLSGSLAQPQALLPSCCGTQGTGETEALSACLRGSCCPGWPEPPSLPQPLAQGVGGGGPSPMCMHLCRAHSGQETQPVGPDGWGCSLALSHGGLCGLCRGLAEAMLSPEGRWACPLASLLSFPGLHQCRTGPWQALAIQSFPLHGARAGRGSPTTAPSSTHIHKFLVQPSKSRPQNGPRGVCGQPPPPQGQHCHHGVDASRYCPLGLQKDESCNLLLLLLRQPLLLLC